MRGGGEVFKSQDFVRALNLNTPNLPIQSSSLSSSIKEFSKRSQEFSKRTQEFSKRSQELSKRTQEFSKRTQEFSKWTQEFINPRTPTFIFSYVNQNPGRFSLVFGKLTTRTILYLGLLKNTQ